MSSYYKFIWKSTLHKRLKFLSCKTLNISLPIKSTLIDRQLPVLNLKCLHGCIELESEDHLFFYSPVARALWYSSPFDKALLVELSRSTLVLPPRIMSVFLVQLLEIIEVLCLKSLARDTIEYFEAAKACAINKVVLLALEEGWLRVCFERMQSFCAKLE